MSETNLNTELLSAEARGRKHIPFAVFAVIIIHVVLFLVLLIAAGCRAKARVKRGTPDTEMAQQQPEGPPPQSNIPDALRPSGVAEQDASIAAAVTGASIAKTSLISQGTEVVLAQEPVLQRVSDLGPRTSQRASSSRPKADAPVTRTYVVRPGDTVGKIAKELGTTVRALRAENLLKNDMIRPGQKLRVSSEKPGQKFRSKEA